MKNKLTILLGTFLITILAAVPVFGNQSQKLTINGKGLELGNWLVLEEGRSYIPGPVVANLSTPSAIDLKLPTKTIYNTPFVPLKEAFQSLGAAVHWDQATNSIMITGDQLVYKDQGLKELLQAPLAEGFVEIKISAAGDVVIGWDENFSKANRFDTVLKEKGNDYKYFFKNVKHIFEVDDLTIVNLETPLTNARKKAIKQFAFKGKPEFTSILKEGSIEAVNLANNHTYDYLEPGFKDTTLNLDRAQIDYFGEGHESIVKVKGINIGNLGYRGWNNSKQIKAGIKKDIEKMKKTADLVIVSFHWGLEGANYPNGVQKDLGRFAIDSGADLVLGHHPHVIQGIEEYKGKNIIYSLANFSFGGNRNPSDKDTFIFQQSFIFNEKKQISSTSSGVIPCSVSSVRSRNDYCPTPQKDQSGERIIQRLKTYSNVFPKPYQGY